MPTVILNLPEGFETFAWEVESKGWLQGANIEVLGKIYSITFYDPTRLAQDIESEIATRVAFFERNCVVIPAVTRPNIEAAIELIVSTGRYVDLTPDEKPK